MGMGLRSHGEDTLRPSSGVGVVVLFPFPQEAEQIEPLDAQKEDNYWRDLGLSEPKKEKGVLKNDGGEGLIDDC